MFKMVRTAIKFWFLFWLYLGMGFASLMVIMVACALLFAPRPYQSHPSHVDPVRYSQDVDAHRAGP